MDWIIDRVEQAQENEGWIWLVFMIPFTLFFVMGPTISSLVLFLSISFFLYTGLKWCEARPR